MTVHRSSIYLCVVALSLLAVGCGSSSTGPQNKASAYAGTYGGIINGPGASGTVTMTVGQSGSSSMSHGPSVHAESGTNEVFGTLTPWNGQAPITFTGSISGNTAMLDLGTTPPGNCTITFTVGQGATGSCLVPVRNGKFVTEPIVTFLENNDIAPNSYCGTQSGLTAPSNDPNATLGALVSGSTVILLVAPPSGTPILYSGTLSGGGVTLTSDASGLVYSGTNSTETATLSGTITGGGGGSWFVTNPCTVGALTMNTTVSASATVGSTSPITNTLTISNGGAGTLGVLGVGAPTYTAGAASGWLQATVSSPTTTGGTLSLSTSPAGLAAGIYTATVPVTASMGTGSPRTVTVTLTINAGQAPPVLSLSARSVTFPAVTQGGAPTPIGVQVTSTGGTAFGVMATIAYPPAPAPQGWLNANMSPAVTPATLTVAAPGATTLSVGSYSATVTISSTTTGVASVQLPVTLVVQSSTSSCVISPSTMSPFYVGALVNIQMTGTSACGTLANQSWSLATGTLPVGLSIGTEGVLFGTPTTAGPYTFAIAVQNLGNGDRATETYTNVPVDLTSSCLLWPSASNGLPNGTVGTPYVLNVVSVTPPCTTAGLDNPADWVWTISAGAPPGLSLSTNGNGTTNTGVVGTPTGTGGTYTFSITFTNTNQVRGANEASATQSYTVTIAP